MKSLFLSALLTFTLLSCKQTTTSTQAASASPNFNSVATIGRWDNLPANGLNLKISTEFSADFFGTNPLETMASNWNSALASSSLVLFKVPFSTTTKTGDDSNGNLGALYDNEMGIYKSHNWFSDVSRNAIAITQYYGIVQSNATLGSYIQFSHADIIVNYRDFGSDLTMNVNPTYRYDLPTVILHEMGHFLGLYHESTSSSVMYPYYINTQRSLKTFDTNKIRALYLNSQNYSISAKNTLSALSTSSGPSTPVLKDGTRVKGIVELNSDGICRHYLNGRLQFTHDASDVLKKKSPPIWEAFYKNLNF